MIPGREQSGDRPAPGRHHGWAGGRTPVVVATMPERVVDPDLDQQAEPVEFTTPEGMTIRFAEPETRRRSSLLRLPASNAAGSSSFRRGFIAMTCEPAVRSARVREAGGTAPAAEKMKLRHKHVRTAVPPTADGGTEGGFGGPRPTGIRVHTTPRRLGPT